MTHKKINLYYVTLKRKPISFRCRDCQEPVLPNRYEKHCFERHRVDAKTTCVWCRSVTWHPGDKYLNAQHLKLCFETHLFRGHLVPRSPNKDRVPKSVDRAPSRSLVDPSVVPGGSDRDGMAEPVDEGLDRDRMEVDLVPGEAPCERPARMLKSEPLCAQKTLFHYPCLPTAEDHDDLPFLTADTPPVEFQNANLTLAASYVTRYFNTRETHDWFHVLVRAVVFESFVWALKEDAANTRTLPFSCWCNGGPYEEAKYRQHRHCIVVSPKGRFQEKVWPKVRMTDRESLYCKETFSCKKFQCKKLKRVEKALHLVNLMGYVSHPKSQCQFTFEQETDVTPERMHHFYLYRNLPEDFRLPLVLLWNDGIYELLSQEKFKNVSIPKVVKGGMERVNRKWQQRIKHFYKYETGWVVPVSKRLVPTDRETNRYLCLMNHKKLYFREVSEPLDEKTWLKTQVEGGNCFYEAVGNEWWTPRRRGDQKILNIHMPVVKANRKVAWMTEQLSVQEKQLKANEVEMTRLKIENEQLKKGTDSISKS